MKSKSGKGSLKLIEQLKYAGASKDLLRKLQRYIVNVPINIFNNIKNANYVEDINGYWVQSIQSCTELDLDY